MARVCEWKHATMSRIYRHRLISHLVRVLRCLLLGRNLLQVSRGVIQTLLRCLRLIRTPVPTMTMIVIVVVTHEVMLRIPLALTILWLMPLRLTTRPNFPAMIA